MKKLIAAAALFAAACASSQTDDMTPAPRVVEAAPDPRVGELQTAMTEMLERIDVLNDRIARLEDGGAAGSPPA
jgi:hypothetical protein